MRLTRFLKPSQIRLDLETHTPDEVPETWSQDRFIWSVKEKVLAEITELFTTTGKVGNATKFHRDLVNREKKATTGIGGGIAIPHVRTMQARSFLLCFARSKDGVEFGATDGMPVHLFFGVCAPPYDDKLYLEVYRNIGLVFGTPEAKRLLMEAGDEHEIIKILGKYQDQQPRGY